MRNLSFLIFVACVLLFSGCSDKIWDYINYNIDFHVVDVAGNDLLNVETAGSIIDNDITVEHRGKVYKKQKWYEEDTVATKASYLWPLGLRVGYNEYVGATLLSFGEFAPDMGYHGETFTINWGDGTQDVIKFDLYMTGKNSNPTVHKRIYLNDKLYSRDSFLITIVRK